MALIACSECGEKTSKKAEPGPAGGVSRKCRNRFQQKHVHLNIMKVLLIFCIATYCVNAYSENLYHPYKVEGIYQFIGNTVVGVTNGSRIWSAYFDRHGSVEFLYSNGETGKGEWSQRAYDTICFAFQKTDGEKISVCKVISSAGQGLYWTTYGEQKPSSEIILILPGKKLADQGSYRSNIKDWAGKLIVGRLLSSGKTWQAAFNDDGFIDFYHASGEHDRGIYFIYDDSICIRYINKEIIHCRRPTIINRKIAWVNTVDDSYISEIVYLHRIKTSATNAQPTPQIQETPAQQPYRKKITYSRRYSEENKLMLKTACVIAAFGEVACVNVLSDYVDANAFNGSSVAATCNAAVQQLTAGEIDPRILGLASTFGGVSGVGCKMREDDPNSGWGALLQTIGAAGSVYLLMECINNVEQKCH